MFSENYEACWIQESNSTGCFEFQILDTFEISPLQVLFMILVKLSLDMSEVLPIHHISIISFLTDETGFLCV